MPSHEYLALRTELDEQIYPKLEGLEATLKKLLTLKADEATLLIDSHKALGEQIGVLKKAFERIETT